MNFRKRIIARLNKKADEIPSNPEVPTEPRKKIPYEVWTNSKKSDGITYEQWFRRVDKLVSKKFGLGMNDFEDWLSADAYEANKTVMQGYNAFCREVKKNHGVF